MAVRNFENVFDINKRNGRDGKAPPVEFVVVITAPDNTDKGHYRRFRRALDSRSRLSRTIRRIRGRLSNSASFVTGERRKHGTREISLRTTKQYRPLIFDENVYAVVSCGYWRTRIRSVLLLSAYFTNFQSRRGRILSRSLLYRRIDWSEWTLIMNYARSIGKSGKRIRHLSWGKSVWSYPRKNMLL